MEFDTEKLQSLEDSPEFAEWEAKMEAWGEEMEVWGEMVEERAEAWEAEMEPRIEAWADAQAERWESQVEFMASFGAIPFEGQRRSVRDQFSVTR